MRAITLNLEALQATTFATTPETEQPKLPDTSDTCRASCLSACGVCPDWQAAVRREPPAVEREPASRTIVRGAVFVRVAGSGDVVPRIYSVVGGR